MLWELEYSGKKFVIDACIKRKIKFPDWFLNRPEIDDIDYFYVDAFWHLNTCRFDRLMPIPWSAIISYGAFKGLDLENVSTLVDIVTTIDAAYLDKVFKDSQRGS